MRGHNMTKTTGTLKEFFDGKYAEIESVGKIDDAQVFSMENYVELNKLDDQVKRNGINPNGNLVRLPQVDSQGFLRATPRDRLVVNESIAFINRITVNKTKKTITMVIDYRAISEQQSGTIYAPTVLGYVIGKVKDEETGEETYAVQSVETVSEADFINKFKDQLSDDDAKPMYEVITHYKTTGTNTGIKLDDLF